MICRCRARLPAGKEVLFLYLGILVRLEKAVPKQKGMGSQHLAVEINVQLRIHGNLLPFAAAASRRLYVAYQTAYLKAHYGAEYMAASMTSKMGKTEDIVTIIQESKRLGIKVLTPDINTSYGVFTANPEGQILYGLAGIRNVGLAVVEDVVAERDKHGPYKDIFDFCMRVAEDQGSFSFYYLILH